MSGRRMKPSAEIHPTEFASLLEHITIMIGCAKQRAHDEVRAATQILCAQHLSKLKRGKKIMKAELIDYRDGNAVAITLSHRPSKHNQTRNPRLLDPIFFAIVLVLEWLGASLQFQHVSKKVDGRDKFYLRERFSEKPGERIYLARMVCDAISGTDARQENDHHSYCLADLAQRASKAKRMPDGEVGRDHAIAAARRRFEIVFPNGLNGMTGKAFEAWLRNAFQVADIYHKGAVQPSLHQEAVR